MMVDRDETRLGRLQCAIEALEQRGQFRLRRRGENVVREFHVDIVAGEPAITLVALKELLE